VREPSTRAAARAAWIALLVGLGLLVYVGVVVVRGQPGPSVEQAALRLRRRDFQGADDMLSGILERDPRNARALALRGACRLKTGTLDAARADFDAALALQPDLVPARAGLAETLCEAGRADEALAAATQLAQAHPDRPGPQRVIGKARYALFQRAARDGIAILEKDRTDARARRAAAEVRRGRFQTADAYLAAKQQSGNPATAAALAGHLETAKRHLEAALEALHAACRTGGDPDTCVFLAEVLLEKGGVEEAGRVVDRARERPGVDRVRAGLVRAESLRARAAQLAARGEAAAAELARRKAMQLLERLARQFPDAASVRERLALTYAAAGRLEDASRTALAGRAAARGIEADYVDALVRLAEKDYDAAVAGLQRIYDDLGGDPRFHYSLGRAYYREGGRSALGTMAASELKHVTQLRPTFLPARLLLARLYLRGGWHDEAREQCLAILDLPYRPARVAPHVYLLLYEANRGLKEYGNALLALDRAVEAAGSWAALKPDADLLLGEATPDEVLDRYRDRMNIPSYVCIRGWAKARAGEREDAVKEFERVLLLDKQFLMANVCLAGVYASDTPPRLDAAAAQYRGAIQMLAALKLSPSSSMHFGLAWVRIRQENFADAETQLRTVLSLDRDHRAAHVALAVMRLHRRQFDGALAQVKHVAHASPEAAFLLGLVYSAAARRSDAAIRAVIEARRPRDVRVKPADIIGEREVNWAQAAVSYDRAAALDDRFRLPAETSLIYAAQSEYGKMVEACRTALEAAPTPTRPALLRRLATAYLGRKDFEQAVKTAGQALVAAARAAEPDPDEVLRGRIVLANCLLAQRRFDDARRQVRQAAGALPDVRNAYLDMIDRTEKVILGHVSHPLPRYGAVLNEILPRDLNRAFLFSRAGAAWLPVAERTYRRLILKDPSNLVSRYHLAQLYLAAGRIEQAQDLHRDILKRDHRFAPILRDAAVLADRRTRDAAQSAKTPQQRLGVQAEAVSLYRDAIRAAPRFWLPRVELAALFDRAGDADQAAALYEQALALRPVPFLVLNDYGRLGSVERTCLERAVERAAAATGPDQFGLAVAYALHVVRDVWTERGPDDETVENSRSLLAGHPASLYRLAVACHKTGRDKPALALLEHVLKTGARFPRRERAITLRAELQRKLRPTP
jgi:tetratricopeptide (TPR) repeat protein